MSNVQVKDTQKLPVKWSAVDVDGNPTTDVGGGTLSYSVSPAAAGTHAADPADPSGLSTIFTPSSSAGNLGTVQLQISASGGSLPAAGISGTLSADVVASAATSFTGIAGTPA